MRKKHDAGIDGARVVADQCDPAALACHSPSIAPVGSVMIENHPMSGTSVTSFMTFAPSDLALLVAALTSSTNT